MNPSNENHHHQHKIAPDVHKPSQFTIVLPRPDTDSNPSNVSRLLSLGKPRKRRRGTPPDTPSNNQVFSLPSGFSNKQQTTENYFSSNDSERNHNMRSNQAARLDVPDEKIVINEEATSEALLALSAGFRMDKLTEEEIDAGVVSVVGGIEQGNYILIRNHIITKWRENVFNWVTKEMFLDVIPSHCSKLLDSAYNYLVSHGYINFGVAPTIKDRILAEPSTKANVIVIGAGLSGLAAARQLMSFGYKVTVLEGRKRPGGRVYTKTMEGANRVAAADLGGSVLTGTHGNPLGILARQLSYPLHKIREKCPLYRSDGQPVAPEVDAKVEIAFNQLLDKASKLRQLMGEVSEDVSLGAALETFWQADGEPANPEEMSLFNWHLANLEYANAGLLSRLSLAFWDQDDPYDMGGDHCFLPGGNGQLVQELAENVPILYEKAVNAIRYGSDGVQVVVNGGRVFEGDVALCTVPLGVLKSGSIRFNPELPQRKLDGIKRLGFGLLNKIVMLFPHSFWGTDLDMFGYLSDDPIRRGEFFLFYSYATVAGGPVLMALVAGEAAHSFEHMPPTGAITRVLQILRGIYKPQGIDVPEPIQTVCTRWGSDPFSLGSYSNVAVGASGDDYDILAESVGDGRLFFAGEATTRQYPATMHGAFLSGLREAANIAHYATNQVLRDKIEKNPSKDVHACASLLDDLFRDPDLAFGSFSVIYTKNNAEDKPMAVLRVVFSGPVKKAQEGSTPDQQHSKKLLFQQLQSHFNQQQELHVYALLSREQVFELREVKGGDEMRLNFLYEKLGVKLVGKKGLGPAAADVISSIKAERSKPTSLLGCMQEADGNVVQMIAEEEETAKLAKEAGEKGSLRRRVSTSAKQRERVAKQAKEARQRAAEEATIREVVRNMVADRGKKAAAASTNVPDDKVGHFSEEAGGGAAETSGDGGAHEVEAGDPDATEASEGRGGMREKRFGSGTEGHRKKKKASRAGVHAFSTHEEVLAELNRRAERLEEAIQAEDMEAERWIPHHNLSGNFNGESVDERREFFDFLLPAKRLNRGARVPTLELMDEADSHLMDFLADYHNMRRHLVNASKAESEHWTGEEHIEERVKESQVTIARLNKKMEKCRVVAREASAKLEAVQAEADARIKAAEEKAASEVERVRIELVARQSALEKEVEAREALQVEVKRQADEVTTLQIELSATKDERDDVVARLENTKECFKELSDTYDTFQKEHAYLVSGIPELVSKLRKSAQYLEPYGALYNVVLRLGRHQACQRIKDAMPDLPENVFGNMVDPSAFQRLKTGSERIDGMEYPYLQRLSRMKESSWAEISAIDPDACTSSDSDVTPGQGA